MGSTPSRDTAADITNRIPGWVKDMQTSAGAVSGRVVDSVPGRVKDTQPSDGAVSGRVVDKNNDQGSVPGRKLDSISDTDTVPSLLDLTVYDVKTHYYVKCERVWSVVFMPSGHVVLACNECGLILLDRNFTPVSVLSVISVSACKVSDTKVLVSQGDGNKILFAQVLPEMVVTNVWDIGKVALGVYYHNGEIYAACWDSPDKGEVRVLNNSGTVVRRFGVHNETYMFGKPYDVKVNNAGDKVFVSDYRAHSITCLDQTGRVLYQYAYTDLKGPTGMLVDRNDNVLVTAARSNIIYLINNEGIFQKVVLAGVYLLSAPWCMSYRHDDGILAIGTIRYIGIGPLLTVKTSLAEDC